MAGNRINRPAGLNVGITGVDRMRKHDDVHLPDEARAHPLFLPEPRPLDQILRRQTLDERLTRDIVPEDLSPELLEPRILTQTRKGLSERLYSAGMRAGGEAQEKIIAGAELLDQEVEMDEDIQEALAALMRG